MKGYLARYKKRERELMKKYLPLPAALPGHIDGHMQPCKHNLEGSLDLEEELISHHSTE
jgi:hypothetical protein